MKSSLKLLAGLLAIAAIIGLAGCQQPASSTTIVASSGVTVYGTVGGRVVGPDGKALAGVTVSATTGGVSKDIVAQVTDSNGHFEIQKLISGFHTIVLGNGKTSTTKVISIEVPDLAKLRTDAALPLTTTNAAGTTVVDPALIKASEGPYFVNISLSTSAPYDQVTLYPCTATLTGIATIQNPTALSTSTATAAPDGTKVIADFSAFNDSQTLLFIGTVSGAAGVFTIANVPAVFQLNPPVAAPGPTLLGTSSATPSISLYLQSEAVTTGINSVAINDTTSNITGSAIISDGVTTPGDSRNLGTLVFIAGLTPTITTYSPDPGVSTGSKFDPGSQAVPTPLQFTFNQPMSPTKGSLALTDADSATTQNHSYLFTGVWSVGNTVYTATPSAMFEYGKTITATFTGFESAGGVAFTGGPIGFKVRDALAFLSANTRTAYGTTPLNTVLFPVAGSVILTFNAPLSSFDPYLTYIQDASGKFIPAGVTISGSTLTFSPTASLAFNMAYKVFYRVRGGLFAYDDIVNDTTGTAAGFTTVGAAQLATPTLAKDDASKYIADSAKQYWQRGKYNAGESALKVLIGYVAGADNYHWEFSYAGDPGWTTGGDFAPGANSLSSDSAYYVASLALPLIPPSTTSTYVIDPAKVLSLRVRAQDISAPISGAADSAWVTTFLTFADTQAPSALSATSSFLDSVAVAAGFADNGPGTSDSFTVTIGSSPNNDQYYQVNFALAGGEPMSNILASDVVAQSGNTSNLSVVLVTMTKNAAGENTACSILIKAGKGATDPAGEYRVAPKDAAGNAYDNLNATPAAVDNVIRIIIN